MDDVKPRRRWLRFSLRTLLIFITVTCSLLAWRVKTIRDVDKAVANLRKAGLKVRPHWHYTPPTYQQFVKAGYDLTKFPPKAYEPPPYWKRILFSDSEREWSIAAIPGTYGLGPDSFKLVPIDECKMLTLIDDLGAIGVISSLDLAGTSIGNESLRGISTLRQLKSLDICDTAIDAGGLTHLESMTWLENLRVGNMRLGRSRETIEGMDRLRAALSTTEIWHQGETAGGPPGRYMRPRWSGQAARPTPLQAAHVDATLRRMQDDGTPPKIIVLNRPSNPMDAEDFLFRGYLRIRKGQIEEAIGDFEESIRLDPKNALVHNKLARMLAADPDEYLRDCKRAVELATKACELTEWKNAQYLETLAIAHSETGDFATAVKWTEQAVSLEPECETYKERLEGFKAAKRFREHSDIDPEEEKTPDAE